jgi:16S rRNA (guanine1207-N2)-methyltransferase
VTSFSADAIYGFPLGDLAKIPAGATQVSPLVPTSPALEDVAQASLTSLVIAAPPGTLERRYVLAHSLRALTPGASLTVIAPKEKGGNRIAKELEFFGCAVETTSRRHQRICKTFCPVTLTSQTEAAIVDGAMRFVEGLNLWSQPGVFSWDRIDPGTTLLISALPAFKGRGADLGCGVGVIARAVLGSHSVTQFDLVDIDHRAITAARRNVADPRAAFHWADVRKLAKIKDLDFVAMNPPFHGGGLEDKALGQAFVQHCQRILRDGGTAWLVANRHLPYEALLSSNFSQVTLRAERGGFKVYEAIK